MFGLLLPILAKLPSLFGTFFKDENELRKLRHQTELKKEEFRAASARVVIEAELEKGTAQLKATSMAFKHFTFVLWFSPFIVSIVFPEYGVLLFERLSSMPSWYAETCLVLLMTVWGVTVSKDVISGIFKNLGTFMLRRQSNKLNLKLPPNIVLAPSDPDLPSNKNWPNPDKDK